MLWKPRRRLRMVRRRTWQQVWPVCLVALVMALIVSVSQVGWLVSIPTVVLPGLLVVGLLWVTHVRRVRAVWREAESGIRSLESWLQHQGRGRRS